MDISRNPTALELLNAGCSVIPVRADKKPALRSWKEFQSRRPTAGEIKQWNRELNPAGYAIVTGIVSQRITFDFDGQEGAELARRWGVQPHRRTGSGGLHLDVVAPEHWRVPTINGRAKKSLREIWPGLDVRGEGGYAIAIGRNESGDYEWLRDLKPDQPDVVPAEVWDFLREGSPDPEVPRRKECRDSIRKFATTLPSVKGKPRAIPRVAVFAKAEASERVDPERLVQRALKLTSTQGRNNAGFGLSIQLRDNAFSKNEAQPIVQGYAVRVPGVNVKGEPEPYTKAEALASVDQAYSRPPRGPWTLQHGAGDAPSLLRFDFNDSGNAERLIAVHGGDLKYCHPFKKWMIWDGKRWTVDRTDQARKLMKQTMVEFLRQAIEERNELAEKFARSSLDARRLANALSLAQPEIYVEPGRLDTAPFLLNVLNGTIDLRTGNLRPHEREDLITKLAPYRYDPNAKCPLILRTLRRLMGKKEALVSHLQKAFGYSATGVTSEKVTFIVYGSGNNGKTTILTTISRILGDYSGVVLIASIMAKEESNNSLADFADLHGARFVKTSETEEGQRLSEGKLKRITQGVPGAEIKACRKYENPFAFPETHKLWMDCNHKPVIRGTDAGIWNRLHLLPFTVTIPLAEIDRELPEKLMAEAEGILAWIVEGAKRWCREGLGRPSEVEAAISEYRGEMDQIGRFIQECCMMSGHVMARQLYTAYRTRALEGGEQWITETAFGLRLKERGFEKTSTASGVRYQGISLQEGRE